MTLEFQELKKLWQIDDCKSELVLLGNITAAADRTLELVEMQMLRAPARMIVAHWTMPQKSSRAS